MLCKHANSGMLCIRNVVYFYEHQMSLLKHFSVISIKPEFGNKKKVDSL